MRKFIRNFKKYRPIFTFVAEISSIIGLIIAVLMMF